MSLQGYLRPSLPQKVLVKPRRHSGQAQPCCAHLHTNITDSSAWLGCFPSTRGSEAQRVIAPCTLGLVFQREPGHVPSSPLAPENMGFSPRAGKW